MKKLYRSNVDRRIVGVCGGIGEYLDVDSNLVRLVFAVIGCIGGFGILFYFLAAAIIPESPLRIE